MEMCLVSGSISAADLLEYKSSFHYSTGFVNIDEGLDGTLSPGNILHISGPPGCGTSQILANIVQSVVESGDHVFQYSCKFSNNQSLSFLITFLFSNSRGQVYKAIP